MCGIAGFIDYSKKSNELNLQNMIRALSHRGPDDIGFDSYSLDNADVGFAQSRLSIIDLSNNGHQPMHFDFLSIVFNGEIYNFNEIKVELISLGHVFYSNSDTEVILHSFFEWGEACVERFIGMFSFVILDKSKEEVFFFRDRAGVKPIYIYKTNSLILFASELKSFHNHSDFKKEINIEALNLFFDLGYIPAPYCIFNDCFKLLPAHYCKIKLRNKDFEIIKYWELLDFYRKPKFDLSFNEAKFELNKLLISACNYRMISDVPVGLFLSGGYDSTGVAAILQSEKSESIKTFTIGFEKGVNEAPHAKSIAKFLGTSHHELICKSKDAIDLIQDLPFCYDEPNSDISTIPTLLVSKFASNHVKVAISSDGGDEIFGGYKSYQLIKKANRILNSIPNFLRPSVKKYLKIGPNDFFSDKFKHKLNFLTQSVDSSLSIQTINLYNGIHSLPSYYKNRIFDTKNDFHSYFPSLEGYDLNNEIDIAMVLDYKISMQPLLDKVDRATMRYSIEGRDPLIDNRLAEFMAQLPIEFKVNGLKSKVLYKSLVEDYIPRQLLNRPKTGFDLPIHQWMKGELRELFEFYCNTKMIAKSNLFDVNFIESKKKMYLDNKLHYNPFMWRFFSFQIWYNKWF